MTWYIHYKNQLKKGGKMGIRLWIKVDLGFCLFCILRSGFHWDIFIHICYALLLSIPHMPSPMLPLPLFWFPSSSPVSTLFSFYETHIPLLSFFLSLPTSSPLSQSLSQNEIKKMRWTFNRKEECHLNEKNKSEIIKWNKPGSKVKTCFPIIWHRSNFTFKYRIESKKSKESNWIYGIEHGKCCINTQNTKAHSASQLSLSWQEEVAVLWQSLVEMLSATQLFLKYLLQYEAFYFTLSKIFIMISLFSFLSKL